VIAWLPLDSDDVVNMACPLALSVPVPSTVAPSLNVTVPVGETPVTFAVNVTDCPNWLGFNDEVSVTVGCAVPTVRVAVLLVLPVPLLVDETGPVVLLYVPGMLEVTLTLTAQEPLCATDPPASEMLPLPAVAVAVPPQLLVSPLGVATTTFAGRLSVNATPSCATAAGLAIVIVRVERPFGTIEVGLKALAIVGGPVILNNCGVLVLL